jgi:hypothetical protein
LIRPEIKRLAGKTRGEDLTGYLNRFSATDGDM